MYRKCNFNYSEYLHVSFVFSLTGSQYIAAFTQQNNYEMRVDMADFDGTFVYASYYNFTVDPNDLYRMNYDLYSGNIGEFC